MTIEYVHEKMEQIAYSLATAIEPMPERLRYAEMPLASALSDAEQSEALPADLFDRLQGVHDRLGSVAAVDSSAALQATLDSMSPEDAMELAIELLAIAAEVERLFNESRR